MAEEQPDNLEKALRWIAYHQGEISAWWHTQWEFNKTIRKDFDTLRTDMEREIRNLMLKLIIIIGLVAGARPPSIRSTARLRSSPARHSF